MRVNLYTTFQDMGEVPPERAWSALRALRASPPGLALADGRRRVFSASLEQAEQLFRAAAGVGVETKPLLDFYGLSQAGRAIAAACARDRWQLTGHGIRVGSGGGTHAGLADMTVKPDSGGSFGRMVGVLESSALPQPTRVGDLWPLLIELARHPLPGSGGNRTLSVDVNAGLPPASQTIEVGGLPSSLLNVGQGQREVASGAGADYDAQAIALDRHLDRFPSLSRRGRATPAGQPVGLRSQGDRMCSATFVWPRTDPGRPDAADDILESLAVRVRGEWRVFPSLDGGERPVHPLLVWWAILFRLSMLARYEPESWAAMTDVNISADAVPIEHALKVALSVVPELLYNILTGRLEPGVEARPTRVP